MAMSPATAETAVISYNLDNNVSSPVEPEEANTYVFTNLRSGDSSVPGLSASDLASGITPVIITGAVRGASGPIGKLTDGVGATSSDDPGNNFVFENGVDPGRFRISLPGIEPIGEVNTYSWHRYVIPGLRSPQKYEVYASDGTAPGFEIDNPSGPGYVLLAAVNSVDIFGSVDGQLGISITPSSGGTLGSFRHFIFDVHPPTNGLDNTLFSEIDIVIPEPATVLLVALGGLALIRRRPK
jgi:hypothetical protein